MTDNTTDTNTEVNNVGTTPVRIYTVNELKTFIDAVEFLHDAATAFVPNARQWSRLRDMIMNLSSEEVIQRPVQRVQPTYAQHAPIQPAPIDETVYEVQQPLNPAVPAGPSAFGGAPMMNTPMPMMSSPVFNGSAGAPSRTPTIDTSNGAAYTSSFA